MAEKLAIEGGAPITKDPFPGWPYFDEESIQAAMEPLRSGKVNYWTGPIGMQFEQKFAEWCGARYGISTSNGTSALHTALAGLGIGPGDEVIVPSYTFIASSFSVCQAGAIPVFADVEKESHTLDPASVEAAISERTRAILPVHLYGIMSNMGPILEIAKKHNLFVVEDCAQAHGAEYKGKRAGTIGDIGAFSFCQSKHFTTGGEGGCVVTDDEDVAWLCRSFRDHGYDVAQRLKLLDLEAKLPYIHNMVGFNYRLTEMQSAIGLVQLSKMDNWNLKNRRRNGEMLTRLLQECEEIETLPLDTPERRNSYWLYPISMRMERLSCDIKQFTAALGAEGIPAGPVLWPQCYQEKAYQERRGFGRLSYPFGDPSARPEAVQYDKVYCPNAAYLEKNTFFVPVHPVYEEKHMEQIAAAILKVAAAYAK
ncbi:MAG TPA: DegT/DnrJ/EryC1/StrS family aminotransferase [Armatimonadetes bacterium]|jgi:dTDP-4-amino-4,6-dideoxygalactose transaminase|nr:DegT/DnrJ/EryC1/StrS family aminotransferase [Armatimonadota bacterium]